MSLIPESKRGYCSVCDRHVWRSKTSADVQVCLECRRARKGPASHGDSGYKNGCRCDVCRSAVAARMREYAARRRAEGRPLAPYENRRKVASSCEHCGIDFLGVPYKANRFCSVDCAVEFNGRRDSDHAPFKIAQSVRLSIYESFGWKCSLCQCPTRPDEHYNHPRYPTLDHVQPRSLGGSDDPENLRLACRQCNTLRGNNVDWAPELVEVA